MKTNKELLEEILNRLDSLSYVKPNKIPDIALYMDQVTTFMDEHLKKCKRNKEDIILTKTMINNYAKNNLLPSPVKKKYTKEHILILIFIYYFKNMLSLKDIEALFSPVTNQYFSSEEKELSLADIYEEIFSMEKEQMERLKKDVVYKFRESEKTFADVETDQKEYLQLFSFICELGFDVYLKKQIMESLIDKISSENIEKTKKRT